MALAVITSARKLRPYFQSHSIVVLTDLPLRTILQNVNQSGRLSNFDRLHRQISPDQAADLDIPVKNWILHVDGASSNKGSGIGVHLQSPTGELIEQSFRLGFAASNNEAEYEALITGLRLANVVGAKRVQAFCNSQLVTSQFSGDYEAKNERMDAYLGVVKKLTSEFDHFELVKDVYAISSTITEIVELATQDTDWRTPFLDYLDKGILPKDKWESRRLKAKSSNYVSIDGKLHQWTANKVLLTCVGKEEAEVVMIETHEGEGANHSGGRALALKLKTQGIIGPPWSQTAKNTRLDAKSASVTHLTSTHQPSC
ncbi:hypothetical protein N665_0049s0044 [Sinapis alba]|nr:hypothetical protein N665_0049s0044 [Sinapis alba]